MEPWQLTKVEALKLLPDNKNVIPLKPSIATSVGYCRICIFLYLFIFLLLSLPLLLFRKSSSETPRLDLL